MRSIAELGAIRATLTSALSWPLLMSLHAEADDAAAEPFTRSIFTLGWNADVPAARVQPLLEELADAGAIEYTPVDARMCWVNVL